jgi:hypothetical protein
MTLHPGKLVQTAPDGSFIDATAIPGILSYMFIDTASSIGGAYRQAVSIGLYSPATQASLSTATVSVGDSVGTFATNSGFPGITFIPNGTLEIHFHARASIGTCRIRADVYKRVLAGTETLLCSSEVSDALSSTVTEFTVSGYIGDTVLLATDVLVVKLIVDSSTTLPTKPTVTLYYDGTGATQTNASLRIPSALPDVGVFVPYTGAIQAVTLGTNGLSAVSVTLTPAASRPVGATEGCIWASTGHHLYYFNGTTDIQLDNAS